MQVKDPSLEKGELKALCRLTLGRLQPHPRERGRKHPLDEEFERELVKLSNSRPSPAGSGASSRRTSSKACSPAQLIAAHHAAMECYRRAMLPEQTFEGWKENLNQANKLSRTYATLARSAEPPPRQGPAEDHASSTSTSTPAARPSSARSRPGVGWRAEIRGNPMQKQSPMHLSPRCGAKTRSGKPVPLAGDAEREMPDARRRVSRSSEGEG